MYHATHCVLCGRYSPACDQDDICPDCVQRYNLGDEDVREHVVLSTDYHVDADWGPTKEAIDLAERVRDEVQPWYSVAYKQGLSIELIDHVISAALAAIARDIQQGLKVNVEYIGQFTSHNGWVHFKADPELLRTLTDGDQLPPREEAA